MPTNHIVCTDLNLGLHVVYAKKTLFAEKFSLHIMQRKHIMQKKLSSLHIMHTKHINAGKASFCASLACSSKAVDHGAVAVLQHRPTVGVFMFVLSDSSP
jgi:hypothetical protein